VAGDRDYARDGTEAQRWEVNSARAVLAAIDNPPPSGHDLLGTAHGRVDQ
jgi:hypothetical protein